MIKRIECSVIYARKMQGTYIIAIVRCLAVKMDIIY